VNGSQQNTNENTIINVVLAAREILKECFCCASVAEELSFAAWFDSLCLFPDGSGLSCSSCGWVAAASSVFSW